MANPQQYIYTALGARTVQHKEDIRDMIYRISVEETPILSLLPHVSSQVNPQKLEDDLQAFDPANAHAESAVAPAATSAARTLTSNWCQDMRKTVTVSNWQANTLQYGVPDEMDYQTVLRMIEIKKDAERFVLSDQAVQAPTPANGRVAKMKGMSAIITTNTNTVANFNQANFDLLARACAVTYGANPTFAYVGPTQKAAIAAWTEQVTRYTTDAKSILNEAQRYETAYGTTYTVIMHKYMPVNIVGNAAVCFGLDLSAQVGWEIHEFLPLTVADLAYLGGSKSKTMEWSLCVLPGVEKANFAFVV